MKYLICLFLFYILPVFSTPAITKKTSLRAPIIGKIPMSEFLQKNGHQVHFSNPVFFVTLQNGEKAVLKFTDTSDLRTACAEVAAYKASEFLGLNFVPETILYQTNTEIGTLQKYIPPACDLLQKEHFKAAWSKISPDKKACMRLFYFIFGQWDPDPSNMIISKQNNKFCLHLIDNSAMASRQKVQYGEHPFVLCFPEAIFPDSENDRAFPFSKAKTILPDFETLQNQFGTTLTEAQIRRLCRAKTAITYVIWKGKFYRQYRFGNPSYTTIYPKKLMIKLHELTIKQVKSFFSNNIGCHFSEQFFKDIIERRNQVLKAYKLSKSKNGNSRENK